MSKTKPITALYQCQFRGTGWEVGSLLIDGKSGLISQRHPALIPKYKERLKVEAPLRAAARAISRYFATLGEASVQCHCCLCHASHQSESDRAVWFSTSQAERCVDTDPTKRTVAAVLTRFPESTPSAEMGPTHRPVELNVNLTSCPRLADERAQTEERRQYPAGCRSGLISTSPNAKRANCSTPRAAPDDLK